MSKIRFSDCELNTERREVKRAGIPASLEPRIFDLLHYLVENRGRAISKDELQDEVWRTVVPDEAKRSGS